MDTTYAVVLAAGKGTRMNAEQPKVLALLQDRPLISWVLSEVQDSGITHMIVVVGYQADVVKQAILEAGFEVKFVLQTEQLGTGHAVQQALSAIPDSAGTAVVTYGDTPFIHSSTFTELADKQQKTGAAVILTTFMVEDPVAFGYGRIKRDLSGNIVRIVEQKECSPMELQIQECNAGPVAYDAQWLRENLPWVKKHDSGEYYLTDLVEAATNQKRVVETVAISNPLQAHGVNTQEHLRQAHEITNSI